MLTIWGRLNSHNVKKVVWLAEEIGLPYERRDIGGAFGMPDEYRALNPNALIPAIEDGGLVLWESNAILRYLAARYSDGELWLSDPAGRAAGDKWMDWQFSFADEQRDAFQNLVRRKPEERDMAAVARAAAAAGKLMAMLDGVLAKQAWLSGTDFAIGDIPMGVYAHTWFTLDIERPELPHVADWYGRLKERPGYARNVMIPLT